MLRSQRIAPSPDPAIILVKAVARRQLPNSKLKRILTSKDYCFPQNLSRQSRKRNLSQPLYRNPFA